MKEPNIIYLMSCNETLKVYTNRYTQLELIQPIPFYGRKQLGDADKSETIFPLCYAGFTFNRKCMDYRLQIITMKKRNL